MNIKSSLGAINNLVLKEELQQWHGGNEEFCYEGEKWVIFETCSTFEGRSLLKAADKLRERAAGTASPGEWGRGAGVDRVVGAGRELISSVPSPAPSRHG